MSLSGRFGDTSGRPFLEGRLIFPRLGITTDVSFLVDTGADECVLMPADAIRSGVDYATLVGSMEVGGVGGTTRMFVEDAVAVFEEPSVGLHAYRIKVLIAPPSPDLEKTSSLLGRSVLGRWRMLFDPTGKSLTFEVVSADLTIPLP